MIKNFVAKAEFICHSDFENIRPENVFHKEAAKGAMPDERYQNRHVLFRRSLYLKKLGNAVLKITADDYFKLYINGKFITQGPPPAYPRSYCYMEIDVSRYLKTGKNIIAAHTYYQGLINRVWVSGDLRSMFWCELTLDGKKALVSDEGWKCALHTGYTVLEKTGYDTVFMECYDSRAEEVGFEGFDFDDSNWEKARIYRNADYILRKSPILPLEVYEIDPKKILRNKKSIFVDFGREYVGQIRVKGEGRKGDAIILRYGEELNEDGSIRFQMRCNCVYEEKWILSGGDDVLSQFDYKAFRYAELIFPETVKIKKITMTVRHYPFNKKTIYKTDNKKLRQVLKLCEDTVHYGVQEVFVDCPTREKGQYLGDVCVSGRAHCMLTRDTTLLKKAIMDFCDTSSVCNGLMAVSSASFMQEIADYSLLLPALVLWTYSADKDLDFVRFTEPYLTGIYRYFKKYENIEGLLERVEEKWNLVDWPENFRDGYNFPLTNPVGAGMHNVLNAFYIGFLQALEQIYSLLGKADVFCVKEKERSFVKAFFNERTGLFCDSTEKTHSAVHSNVLPLLFRIGTENEETRKRLIEFITEKKLTSMGVYMAYFALAAFIEHGEKERAIALVTDENAWLNMLKQGATATFEAWGKEQKWNTSLFHLWATAPLIVFAENVKAY